MRTRIGRWIVRGALLIAIVALAFGARAYFGGKQARDWEALTKRRRINLICRSLLPIQTFLNRHGLGADLTTEFAMGGYRENYTHLHGSLVRESSYAGNFDGMVYYRGYAAEPSSIELSLTLESTDLGNLSGDLKQIAGETRLKPGSQGRLGEISWEGSLNDKKETVITLRISYPCHWLADIPDYDRGFHDEFRFDRLPQILQFLYREALADQYTPLALQLPIFNSPTNVSNLQLGLTGGYFRTKGNRLIPIEISLSSTGGWSPKGEYMIVIGNRVPSSEKQPIPPELIIGLFKPAFRQLAMKPLESSSEADGIQIRWTSGADPGVTITAKSDYPFESSHLTPYFTRLP